MNTIDIKAPLDIVKVILIKPNTILRLNPSWDIKEIKSIDESSYSLILYNDRTDETFSIIVNIEVSERSIGYKINSNRIDFLIDELEPSKVRLSISGDFLNEADIPYWLKGLKNYIQLEAKQSRIIKGLLDRLWLRMTPSQRRITMIIIIAEGIGILVLVITIVALRLIKIMY
jgi:hypothetical protein